MFFVKMERIGVDDVAGVAVVGNHDVLISTGSTDMEASSVISV